MNLPVKKRKPVNVDGVKYFTSKEIKMLRKLARMEAESALQKNQLTGIRNWMIIDFLTCTGVRVSECSNMKVGNLKIGHGQSEIFVSEGKGGISGTVIIPLALKKHLISFLQWKKAQGEKTGQDDFLFIGQRGKMTSQGIQQIVKRYLKILGIYSPGKSVHALRHSFAMELYSREKDLRAVQKQLRHVSIQSTLVYADVSKDELASQVKGLWN